MLHDLLKRINIEFGAGERERDADDHDDAAVEFVERKAFFFHSLFSVSRFHTYIRILFYIPFPSSLCVCSEQFRWKC